MELNTILNTSLIGKMKKLKPYQNKPYKKGNKVNHETKSKKNGMFPTKTYTTHTSDNKLLLNSEPPKRTEKLIT